MTSSLAEKWSILDRAIQKLRYRQVTEHIRKGCVLADLGCGNGDFLRSVQGRIAFGYGIDSRVNSALNNSRLSFLSGDLNGRFPLDDESVDIVTSMAVIEHLHDLESFSKEIHRILKPGGSCIITTPAPAAKRLLEFLAYKLKVISSQDVRDHKRYLNKGQLSSLFAKFRKVDIWYFQFGLNTAVHAIK